MSDQIPFHIQEDIIKRLPVKPLLQYRSVSKAWKSLIDSSEFIAAHSALHTHPQHLLVKYEDLVETEDKYVSFIDDDTFLQQRFVPTLPFSVKSLNLSIIVGSSHGLLCLHGYQWGPENSHRNLKSPKTVLWNPSVRKSVVVDMPNLVCGGEEIAVGFGGNGEMYLAICPVSHFELHGRSEVDLPDSLAQHSETEISVSKVRESLAMLQYSTDTHTDKDVCSVWIMEHGVRRLFTKLFTISAPHGSMTVLGFRKSGQPIIEVKDDLAESSDIAVHDSNSEEINDLEICGITNSFRMISYMETLTFIPSFSSPTAKSLPPGGLSTTDPLPIVVTVTPPTTDQHRLSRRRYMPLVATLLWFHGIHTNIIRQHMAGLPLHRGLFHALIWLLNHNNIVDNHLQTTFLDDNHQPNQLPLLPREHFMVLLLISPHFLLLGNGFLRKSQICLCINQVRLMVQNLNQKDDAKSK
ncbi:unnamed protein product [Lactuca saligna]|uniref:F-box domain-containing protein n=1 Tax=Lactuca saligna TaxID=75948 RepID=A0AA35YE11_LACSI|nr:unnamed protein product [Lactuca saligna]